MTPFRHYIQLVFSFLVVCFVGGVVYGWPALRQQLIADGSTLTEKNLGAAYTFGSWSTQGCRFLTGVARDRFGTRIVTCISLLAAAFGFLGIGLLDPSDIASLCSSMFVIGIGSGAQLCVQPVASLFPSSAGSILSSMSGAFQISGLVFLALTTSNNRRVSFISFGAVVMILAGASLFLLPRGLSFVEEDKGTSKSDTEPTSVHEKYQGTAGEIVPDVSHTDQENIEHDNRPDDLEDTIAVDEATSISDELDADELTAWQQILSMEYILLVTWFSVIITPLQYYIGSIGFQLEAKGDSSGFYADLFSILYATSALFAPAVGYLADRVGVGIVQGISTILSSASFFILAADTSLNVQTSSLACNGLGRMFVYGMFFTHLGKRLGYRNFGTLAGLGLLVSAIVSLAQYPLISLAAEGRARVVNLTCGSAILATLPYCVWLSRREHNTSTNNNG